MSTAVNEDMDPDDVAVKKDVKPGRYDRRSVKEYEDEGFERAVEYFKRLGGTFRKDTAKVEDVRSAIDLLPPDAELQATMSDFWLRLTKTQARARRASCPPPSPFVKKGRTLLAEKQHIAAWDAQWLAREAARVFAKSGSSQSRAIGDILRTRLPWLMAQDGSIVGCAGEIPMSLLTAAIERPQELAVKWMPLEQALLRAWLDVGERGVWLSRFKEATREVLARLEQCYLSQATEASQTTEPRRPLRP